MDNNFINISQRAYKFIRGYSMNNVYDGFVELITNCDDAYDKNKIKDKKIEIICDYLKNQVIVRDQAIGLSGDDMIKCFLQVGEYTSSKDSRGFFSRGAKDISALGNITFDAIKDNKYSQIKLSSDAIGKINIKDAKVTKDIRNKLKISNNGLQVTIDLLNTRNIDSPDFLINRFPRYYSLRKIFSDKSTKITLEIKKYKTTSFNKIYNLTYSNPKGSVILYLTYTLPSYPDAEILFVLNKSDKILYEDKFNNKHFSNYGILITSNKTIHDISCLDTQNNYYSDMKKMFGIINTSYINKLMFDFDKFGPTLNNPAPIVDPSRMNGLNTKHPFYKELIKIPNDRIRLLLEEKSFFEKEHTFYIDEINEFIKELDIIGSGILESNEITTIGKSKTDKLIRGIESDRGKYVNVEKNVNYPLCEMEHDEIEEFHNQIPIDPMTKLFDIIGRGDEGTILTDKLAKEKLFNIADNSESEKKKIFVYDKVDIQNNNSNLESLNSVTIEQKNIFSIKFIEFSDNVTKYEINNFRGQIILKINTNFPTIQKYFNNNIIDKNKIEAVIVLGNIISEGLTKIQLSSYIDKDYIKLNNNDSHTNYDTIFKNFDNYKNNIEKRLSSSISKMIYNMKENKENKE
jgi:hypothetical protein